MLGTVRRFVAVGGVVTALLLSSAVSAQADIIGPVNCRNDPANPVCVIVIGTPGGGGGGGGSSSAGCHDGFGRSVPCYIPGKGWIGDGYCYWQKATGDELAAAIALGGAVTPPGYWYLGSCGDPTTNFWPATMTRFMVYGTDPGVLLLAQEAIKHLSLPAPRIRANPGAATVQVVYVPTWLWIEPGEFTARSATASVAGLSVTAVATPVKVTWSTGDGSNVTCGKGTPWTEDTDPAAASPDCGYTYTTSSRSRSGGMFALSATITWTVAWSGGGAAGTEPALTSTSTVQLRVTEASVVNTR